ncbi:MAG: tRNA preQ1(34) S-adenosylmethionine ribosyltransferase-isomerase QueA [Phycisphaerae bacterium]
MALPVDAFDFDLPADRIAQQPLKRRDASRLMHLDRSRSTPADHRFSDLPDLLCPGDLLVVNNTRVIPARFTARRASGGRIEGLYLQTDPQGQWELMLKGANRCRPGEALELAGSETVRLVLGQNLGKGRWLARPEPPAEAAELLEQIGAAPLPPYIRRPGPDRAADEQVEQDKSRYQTVFSQRPGAVAAPTAGLHFTPELLERLAQRGIERTSVTLHVGLGTFLPVKASTAEQHEMHAEWYELSESAAAAVDRTKQAGRRVVAVGTTSVRVLETVASTGPIRPETGQSRIYIYPPAEFHCVDAMITNFHLPRSTLLMLVSAFVSPGSCDGIVRTLAAYRRAVETGYRFYSYGDAMLIT